MQLQNHLSRKEYAWASYHNLDISVSEAQLRRGLLQATGFFDIDFNQKNGKTH